MQNKPTSRWLDVQIVIATLAMAVSLFLWNLFAGGSSSVSSGTAAGSQSSAASSSASAQTFGQILLGGAAPQVHQVQAGSNAPAPVTITSSSRP